MSRPYRFHNGKKPIGRGSRPHLFFKTLRVLKEEREEVDGTSPPAMEGCATKLLLLLQLMAMTTSPVQADSLDLALVDTLASHFALDRLVVFKKDVPAGIKERRRLLNTREKATKVAHSFGSVAAKDLKMSDALVLASDFSPEEVSSALRMSKNIAGTTSNSNKLSHRESFLDVFL